MDEKEISRNNRDLIYLVACALHATAPVESVTAGMDFDALYHMAQNHSLTAITCMGLENANAFSHCSPELARKWKEAKEKAIRKNLLLDAERQKILAEMEKAGIWYMPLKGIILKDLYPKLGMRQMADNDILFDASRAEEVKHIFEDQGYSCHHFDRNNHDIYEKPPVMEFELHRELFDHKYYPERAKAYQDIKSRLLSDDGRKYSYRFSDEDFYVYITAHAQKHFIYSGTGLRTLVDFYVYNWKKGASLNWDYISSQLESMGLADYEHSSRQLADKLFSAPNLDAVQELSEDEKDILAIYLGSGTYGTMAIRVSNQAKQLQDDGQPIRKRTKVKMLLLKIFPDRKYYKEYYPFLYRNPWLIPFFVIYRIGRGTFGIRGKTYLRELRTILRLR